MSPKANELLAAAIKLEDGDRAELAEQLRQSLPGFADDDTEDQWIAEIERRSAELNSGESEAVPWESVKSDIREALAKRNESAA